MPPSNQAQSLIGRCIRRLREERKLTLDQAAAKAGITYQYLSGIENGKENFTISVLESVASALDYPLKVLVDLAYSPQYPKVNPKFFRKSVPLPEGLTIESLEIALNHTQAIICRINQNLLFEVRRKLAELIQGNNFSGLVSNILSDAISENSPYNRHHDQRYPDLVNKEANKGQGEGLEVKCTVNAGKGGESHNGHAGWHLIACYERNEDGDIQFVHVMLAKLNGHQDKFCDWKYLGSRVNKETGSRRTETYVTTLEGTTKLRDGSIYLDPTKIDFRRWKQKRHAGESTPEWSIFYQPPAAPSKKSHDS